MSAINRRSVQRIIALARRLEGGNRPRAFILIVDAVAIAAAEFSEPGNAAMAVGHAIEILRNAQELFDLVEAKRRPS